MTASGSDESAAILAASDGGIPAARLQRSHKAYRLRLGSRQDAAAPAAKMAAATAGEFAEERPSWVEMSFLQRSNSRIPTGAERSNPVRQGSLLRPGRAHSDYRSADSFVRL